MSRRSTTPLFELLDASRPIEPMPSAKPGEPKDAARPDPAQRTPAREAARSESRPLLVEGLGRPALVGRLIVLPVPFALIGLGVLVVLAAVLWASAYSMGDRRARTEEQAKFAALGGSNIVDPIGEQRPSGSEPTRNLPGQTPVERPGTGASERPVQTPRPAAKADPRQEGLNYLRLASLNEPEAVEAVNRLRAGGLEAFMVPLESQARRGNNPSRFAVYLTKGFAGGGQFSASRAERSRLESLAKRIGEAWVSEGGPTGFQEPFWDKYVP